MEFRQATLCDTDKLRAIAYASEAHWGYSADFMGKFDASFNITGEFITKYPVYVGIEDNQIVCFWAVLTDGEVFELEYFYIDSSIIGRGYGRKMWRNFIDWCRENNVRTITWVTSHQAIGFYEKMGAVRQADVKSSIDGRQIPFFQLSFA